MVYGIEFTWVYQVCHIIPRKSSLLFGQVRFIHSQRSGSVSVWGDIGYAKMTICLMVLVWWQIGVESFQMLRQPHSVNFDLNHPKGQLRIRSWNLPWLGTYSHHVSGFTGEAQGSVTPLEIVHQRPPDVAPHISTLQPQTTVRTSGIPTWMTRSHSTKLGLMPSSPSTNEAAASLIAVHSWVHWSSFSFTCKVWMLDSFDVRWRESQESTMEFTFYRVGA